MGENQQKTREKTSRAETPKGAVYRERDAEADVSDNFKLHLFWNC